MKYRRIIKFLLAIFLIWFLGHLVYTTIDGLRDEGRNADIAVVLGSKVNEDGSLSERLKQRLKCGLHLYEMGRVKKIIVSGGLGKEGYYEGDKMRDFLIQNGISDSLIIVDNNGNNTIATVDNTLKLKSELNYQNLIIVSQYFHVTRTKMLFRKRDFNNVSSVSPRYFEFRDVYALFREFVAYYTQ
jgi:vancomycin permeability regulator SanA